MMRVYIIDGKYLYETLRRAEVVLNFEKLALHGNLRKYYTCILRGRKPPAIGEWLRHNGYAVNIHQGDYDNEHVVDMAVDIVHLAYAFSLKTELELNIISDKTALIPAIELAKVLGAEIAIVSSSSTKLKRNSCNFQTLEEFMNVLDLAQARDFTQDKLQSRTWIGLHEDEIPGEDPRGLIHDL
jgi:hypothetical protein